MPWLPCGGDFERDSESVGLHCQREGEVGSRSRSHTWVLLGQGGGGAPGEMKEKEKPHTG